MDLVAPNTISSALFPGGADVGTFSKHLCTRGRYLCGCRGAGAPPVVQARAPANASKSLWGGEPRYGTFLLVTGLGYRSCREQ